jgi:ABC-type multidrug transport system fused ATPase/permease subunit
VYSTIAYNLDPTGKIPKEQILAVLKKAKLDEIILKKSKEEREKEAEAAKEKKAVDENVVIMEDLTKKEEKSKEEYTEEEALLNFEVNDNLSSGEKSLVQICRAVLRKNKIVLLDEATANIDIETEQMVQKLINEEFKNCTMLTVAHRLQTIIKSDKVMVMSYGKVAEFDGPQTLLKNPKSHFTKLVNDLKKEEKEHEIEKKREELMKNGGKDKSSESKS